MGIEIVTLSDYTQAPSLLVVEEITDPEGIMPEGFRVYHIDLLNKYKEYPDHTKAMFSEFATMYREIKSMGLDPVLLAQTWK